VNNIIAGENAYIATVGKGLKECSIEGRFHHIRVILLIKDEDKSK
jgi:hypothetical protein